MNVEVKELTPNPPPKEVTIKLDGPEAEQLKALLGLLFNNMSRVLDLNKAWIGSYKVFKSEPELRTFTRKLFNNLGDKGISYK